MRRALLIAAGALSLAACAQVPAGGVGTVSPAEKTLLGAETAYNVAATAERDFCPDGVPKTAKCVQGDDARHKGYAAILAARTAYNSGQPMDVASIASFTAQLTALFPEKK